MHIRARGAAALILSCILLAGLSGCKSREKEQEIERIKKNLKAMLKDPVDMHQARMDEAQQRFTDQLEALLSKPNAEARKKVLREVVEQADTLKVKLFGEEIQAVGISPDHWTVKGEPGGVLINNLDEAPIKPGLVISTGAPEDTYPLTVTIDDGDTQQKVVFKEIGAKKVTFSQVPGKTKRLFIIDTDKTWTPGTHDKRKLGVRLSVSLQPYLSRLLGRDVPKMRARLLQAVVKREVSDYMPILDPNLLALGLSPDSWTTGDGPAGLVVAAGAGAAYTPRLTLSCNARPTDLPITATFHGPAGEQKVTFDKPGHQLVTLPEVAAGQSLLYLVTTDKTFNTEGREGLGVRLTDPVDGSLRSLLARRDPALRAKTLRDLFELKIEKINVLGNLAVAVGLSGDRWTVDGKPAGLGLANPGARAFAPKILLSCGATGKDAPITAIVDDGKEKRSVTFSKPGIQEVELPAVAPGKKKLYIISTDKTWSPGTHDKRTLGVNVGITLGAVLSGMLREAGEKTRDEVARAIMQTPFGGKVALGSDYLVADGVSADRWTTDGQPAAVVGMNPGDVAWAPRVMFSVGAKKKDLPVTVLIDDGIKAVKMEFTEADAKLVTLSPILPGKHRLYVVTTDKTWSLPPQDPRALGVNIRPAPGSAPPGAVAPTKGSPPATAVPAAAKGGAAAEDDEGDGKDDGKEAGEGDGKDDGKDDEAAGGGEKGKAG